MHQAVCVTGPVEDVYLYPPNTLDLEYKHDATDGMHDAFTLASQLRGALDKLADKKPLATRELSKKDAEIHKVLGYIFLTGKEKLDETDFGPLRRMSPLIVLSYAWLSPLD